MHNFSALSDIEFEGLVGDLLAAELSTAVERFSAGPDGGIDLRWRALPDGNGVGQCKHYLRSSFSQLLSAARREVPHVEQLGPDDYRFITSFDLSVAQKDRLYVLFKRWMADPHSVLGGRDLDGLLTKHENVERRHPKLWLASGSQLFWSLHSNLASRSAALRDRIESALPRYVVNRSYEQARELLEKHRVCVIAGVPGIGKTTLAYVLLADAIVLGFEPVEVSADIEEAWISIQGSDLQVFLYDDFLGQLSFGERLGKNEDKRLSEFIAKVSSMQTKRLIMTTREYVLQDARQSYERLNSLDKRLHFVLELEDYTRADRARILYNHLWHADLSPVALHEIAAGGYKRIIDHPAYSPRLIEYCTGNTFDNVNDGYVARFVDVLDHPSQLWHTAFEQHLRIEQQLVVVSLATLPARTSVKDLQSAHQALCERLAVPCTASRFRSALATLEGTFIAIEHVEDTPSVRLHNPSITEFVLDWLADDRRTVAALIESAVFFEQLRQIYTQTAATAGGRASFAPRAGLLRLVGSMRRTFVDAVSRTIDGSPAERRNEWDHNLGTVYRQPSGWFESRLEFCLDLGDEWTPDDMWLIGQVNRLRDRWKRNEGGKAEAVSLMRHLRKKTGMLGKSTDEHDLLVTAVDSASAALDGWLASALEETEEDWVPYLERLERDHVRHISSDSELAARFEEFAREELSRWSPSPPGIEALLEYANKFQLSALVAALEEQIEADRNMDDGKAKNLPSRSNASISVVDDSDSAIQQMFSRLSKR